MDTSPADNMDDLCVYEFVESAKNSWTKRLSQKPFTLRGIKKDMGARELSLLDRRAFTRALKDHIPDCELNDDELEQRTAKLLSPMPGEWVDDESDETDESEGEFTRANPFSGSNSPTNATFRGYKPKAILTAEANALEEAFRALDVEGYVADLNSDVYEMVDNDDLRFPEACLWNAADEFWSDGYRESHFARPNCFCRRCDEQNMVGYVRQGLMEVKDYAIKDEFLASRVDTLLRKQERQAYNVPRPGEKYLTRNERADNGVIRLHLAEVKLRKQETETFQDVVAHVNQQKRQRQRQRRRRRSMSSSSQFEASLDTLSNEPPNLSKNAAKKANAVEEMSFDELMRVLEEADLRNGL